MTALIIGFAKRFGGWILGILATIGFVITLWASVRKSARDDAKVFQAEETFKHAEAEAAREIVKVEKAKDVTIEAMEKKDEVTKDISTHDDSAIVERLRDNWSRD